MLVASPVFQLYVVAPLAIKVVDWPAQIVVLIGAEDELIESVGDGRIDKENDVTLEQAEEGVKFME